MTCLYKAYFCIGKFGAIVNFSIGNFGPVEIPDIPGVTAAHESMSDMRH
jgi:hypothetical protein